MLPYWCLLDVLKYLNRNELEHIQVTNRMLNDIVNQDFGTRPLRIIFQFYILFRNNEFVFAIRKIGCCFVPNIREWYNDDRGMECEHFFPINEMRPFLCKNVRFRVVIISTLKFENRLPYTSDHIATLESISHVFTTNKLSIYDQSNDETSCLKLLLQSPSLLRCHILRIGDRRKRERIMNHPILYSLHAIIFGRDFEDVDIWKLVEQKTSFPNSDTIFMVYSSKNQVNPALEVVKRNFLASEHRCRLRLIIDVIVYTKSVLPFRLKNTRTNEVLELKHMSGDEARELDVDSFYDPVLFLERRVV